MKAWCGFALVTVLVGFVGSVGCGGSAPNARYPAREAGCPVKTYPSEPPVAVEELGLVEVECAPGRRGCERQAMDVVCARGGDIAWGLADNALTATRLVLHAAHTVRVIDPTLRRGCAVHVFTGGAPPMQTENIGPVTALCSPDVSAAACLRELEDQACLLGGDVLWELEGPTPAETSEGPRQRMRGRAAHIK